MLLNLTVQQQPATARAWLIEAHPYRHRSQPSPKAAATVAQLLLLALAGHRLRWQSQFLKMERLGGGGIII
jgi:hypothetical protein